jgi:hypothetical protein
MVAPWEKLRFKQLKRLSAALRPLFLSLTFCKNRWRTKNRVISPLLGFNWFGQSYVEEGLSKLEQKA